MARSQPPAGDMRPRAASKRKPLRLQQRTAFALCSATGSQVAAALDEVFDQRSAQVSDQRTGKGAGSQLCNDGPAQVVLKQPAPPDPATDEEWLAFGSAGACPQHQPLGQRAEFMESDADLQRMASRQLEALDGHLEQFTRESEAFREFRAQSELADHAVELERERLRAEMEAERLALQAQAEAERKALRKEKRRLETEAERRKLSAAEERTELRQSVDRLQQELVGKGGQWRRAVDRLQWQVEELYQKNLDLQSELTSHQGSRCGETLSRDSPPERDLPCARSRGKKQDVAQDVGPDRSCSSGGRGRARRPSGPFRGDALQQQHRSPERGRRCSACSRSQERLDPEAAPKGAAQASLYGGGGHNDMGRASDAGPQPERERVAPPGRDHVRGRSHPRDDEALAEPGHHVARSCQARDDGIRDSSWERGYNYAKRRIHTGEEEDEEAEDGALAPPGDRWEEQSGHDLNSECRQLHFREVSPGEGRARESSTESSLGPGRGRRRRWGARSRVHPVVEAVESLGSPGASRAPERGPRVDDVIAPRAGKPRAPEEVSETGTALTVATSHFSEATAAAADGPSLRAQSAGSSVRRLQVADAPAPVPGFTSGVLGPASRGSAAPGRPRQVSLGAVLAQVPPPRGPPAEMEPPALAAATLRPVGEEVLVREARASQRLPEHIAAAAPPAASELPLPRVPQGLPRFAEAGAQPRAAEGQAEAVYAAEQQRRRPQQPAGAREPTGVAEAAYAAEQQLQPPPQLAAGPCEPSSSAAGLSELVVATKLVREGLPDMAANPSVVRETGRVERDFSDGRREVVFPNGLRKVMWDDGRAAVFFQNGDVKESRKDGTVVYRYWATGAVQTTSPDGTNIFLFANGQLERHLPDGSKEIVFPSGACKTVSVDGSEEVRFVGGGVRQGARLATRVGG